MKIIIIPIITLVSSLLGFEATASQCSSKQIAVCTISKGVKRKTKDHCVNINEIENFKNGHDEEDIFVGECDEFDNEKVVSYACNAGLRFLGTDTALNEQKANYINFSVADYTGALNPVFTKKTINASSTLQYNEVSKEPSVGFNILENGSSLQFGFGSDLYGAEYFVDLCIINSNSNPARVDFNLTGKILFTQSIFSTQNYNNASLLLSKSDLVCVNEDGSLSTSNLIAESRYVSAERNFKRLVPGSAQCFVRHYFKESAKLISRENNYKKVTFQTQLLVEPNDETLLLPKKVELCKIKKVASDKYICTPWKSNSGSKREDLLNDIINGHFVDNDVYFGACPQPCKI